MWRMLVCLGGKDSVPLSTHSRAAASSTTYSVPRGFERMGFERMGFERMGFQRMGFQRMGFHLLPEKRYAKKEVA